MSCFHLVFIISVDWSFILPITVNQKREKKKDCHTGTGSTRIIKKILSLQ